jgi:hypothetical protein
MSKFLSWIDGRKTYIFNVGFIVYAAGAYYGVVPSVDETIAIMTLVLGNAITFRSATKKITDSYPLNK